MMHWKTLAWVALGILAFLLFIDYGFIQSGVGPSLVALAGSVAAMISVRRWNRRNDLALEKGQPISVELRRGRRRFNRIETRSEALFWMGFGLIFCYIGLGLLLGPWLGGPVNARMRFSQMIAPFQVTVGVLFVTHAWGYLVGRRASSSVDVEQSLSDKPEPSSPPNFIEPTVTADSVQLAGYHNARLVETGNGILELRPIRDLGSLLDPLNQACAGVRFDRNPGHRPRLVVFSLPGLQRGKFPPPLDKAMPLENVIAVELTPLPELEGEGPEAVSWPTCRLRLLLKDASCPTLDLAAQAHQNWARATGKQLASFLGVPLEDRLDGPGLAP
jgi:hypothetical protein